MHAYLCTHIGTDVQTHTDRHTHRDAWTRVRQPCQRHWLRRSMCTCGCAHAHADTHTHTHTHTHICAHSSTDSMYLNPSQTAHSLQHFTILHSLLTHINTKPLLHFNTMRSGANTCMHTDTHTPP